MSERVATVLKGQRVLFRPRRQVFSSTGPDEEIAVQQEELERVDGEIATENPPPEESSVPNLETLEAEFERRLAQAVEEARQEGYRQGLQEIKPVADLLEKLTRELHEERHQLLENAELTVVRLAYEIAKKILHREVAENSDVIVYVVREALRRIADRDKIVVRVHPDDAAVLRQATELQDELFQTFAGVEIREDEEVSKGGCLVETSTGLIDATLETQLAEVEAALFGDT